MKNSTRYILLVVILVIVIAAIYILQQNPVETEPVAEIPTATSTEPESDVMIEEEEEIIMPPDFEGAVLSFSDSPVLDFNEGDYNQALDSGRVIILFFYAKWCPVCQAEIPKFYEAMEELNNPNLVGFRVNYNDDDTDSFEEQLARDFGVAYQHTKVILVDGMRELKAPDSWEKDRYITELNNYLN